MELWIISEETDVFQWDIGSRSRQEAAEDVPRGGRGGAGAGRGHGSLHQPTPTKTVFNTRTPASNPSLNGFFLLLQINKGRRQSGSGLGEEGRRGGGLELMLHSICQGARERRISSP